MVSSLNPDSCYLSLLLGIQWNGTASQTFSASVNNFGQHAHTSRVSLNRSIDEPRRLLPGEILIDPVRRPGDDGTARLRMETPI